MKKIVFYILSLVLLTGCSTDSDNPINPDIPETSHPEEAEKELGFSLKASKTALDLLEMTNLSISFERDITVADIKKFYDALEWIVKDKTGTESTFSLMDETSFNAGWGHCFHYPGTFTSFLVGKKDGEIVYRSDSLTFSIPNDKDFLGWDWNELPDTTSAASYVNVLDPSMELTSLTLSEPDKKGISIYLFNPSEDEASFYEQSSEKLYRYMVTLYGTPKVDKNSEKLNETYQAEFAYQFPSSKPLAIWETAKSRMILLEVEGKEGIKTARVFAEPVAWEK